MKQEEEPWIDHLKQRVNEYEKPLPENDWNHFRDGQACRRIVDAILWKRGLRDQPPEEFSAG